MKILKTIIDFIMKYFLKKEMVLEEKTNLTKRNYLYNSQRNNKIRPHKDCFTTSVSIVVNAYCKNRYADLDNIIALDILNNIMKWKKFIKTKWYNLRNYYPSTIYKFWEEYFKNNIRYGVKAKYKILTQKQIRDYIDKDIAIIIGTKATRQGHVIVIIGYTKDGFIVHDPYGDYSTGYKNKDGEMLLYKYKAKLWKVKSNCLIITED